MTTRYTALVTTPTTITTDAPATTGSLRTLGTTNPQNLGSPAPGTATSASASDHIHQMPSAGDVGAIPTSALTATAPQALGAAASSGSSSNVSRLDHVHPFPTASNVGADPAGSAATAQSNAVIAANAYTDAAIFAVTTSSGRAKIATTVTVPDLSAVTVATLDPPYVPVAGDKVLLLGSASPDGVAPATAAYGGLYDVGAVVAGVAPITRNTNYNTIAEICGASWFVTDGTYSNDFWACTTDPTGAVLDTTLLTFVQIAGALSNNAAQPLGVAASGTSHDVSRADHVHVTPPFPPAMIPLGGYATVDGTMGTVVIGGSPYALIDTDYARTGLTATWTFVVGGSVTLPDTGTVVLWDVGAAAAAATITVTSATAATSHSAAMVAPTGASPSTYELRASVTGGGASNYVVVNSAAIRVTWA